MNERKKVNVGNVVFSNTTSITLVTDPTAIVEIEQELIYLGQDGTSFSLGYRESTKERRREPFDLDVHYEKPMANGFTDITFRGLRLRVYSASNTEIEIEDCTTD